MKFRIEKQRVTSHYIFVLISAPSWSWSLPLPSAHVLLYFQDTNNHYYCYSHKLPSKAGICSALPPKASQAPESYFTQETRPVSNICLPSELQLLVLILKPGTVMCLNSRGMIEWKCSHLITSHIQITVYANLAITSKVIGKAMQSNSILWLPSIIGGKNQPVENLLRGRKMTL